MKERYDKRAKHRVATVEECLGFREVWEDLAQKGIVDAFGGAESRRVFSAWIRAQKPKALTMFIIRDQIGTMPKEALP